jgi:uroporphyrinogen-III synthase
MRLLVTRPSDQAARTAQRLRSLGHDPVLAPVMEIAPTEAEVPSGPFDLVLATSAQAFLAQAFLAGATRLAPLACVGEKTAAAGRAAGFGVAFVAPDAEALADALLRDAPPRHVLYLAGQERKPRLEQRLHAAAWRVEISETYAARPVNAWLVSIVAELSAGRIDGVLHYSPRSAELSLVLMGEAATRLAHFCLSPAVAAVCRGHVSPEKIFVASQPDEDSLLTVIQEQNASSGVLKP